MYVHIHLRMLFFMLFPKNDRAPTLTLLEYLHVINLNLLPFDLFNLSCVIQVV
jgi:hypothetical protein